MFVVQGSVKSSINQGLNKTVVVVFICGFWKIRFRADKLEKIPAFVRIGRFLAITGSMVTKNLVTSTVRATLQSLSCSVRTVT